MEEKEVMRLGMDRQIMVTDEQLKLVKSVIFPDSTDDELKLFIYECQRRGVHPLDRKIYPIKRSIGDGEKRLVFQTSIDILRSESKAEGDEAGISTTYGPEKDGYPEWVEVTVYRYVLPPKEWPQAWLANPDIVPKLAYTGRAYWKEYYPGERLGHMWRKMPHHMLAKCAEAIARRLAWPQRLEKLYAEEEFGEDKNGEPKITETVRAINDDDTPSEAESEAPSKRTVNDTLKAEIDAITQDINERKRILRQVSSYTDETGKERYIEYERILKVSNRWAGKALNNLRKMLSEKPKECTQDPNTCPHSGWSSEEEGMIAYCMPRGIKCDAKN